MLQLPSTHPLWWQILCMFDSLITEYQNLFVCHLHMFARSFWHVQNWFQACPLRNVQKEPWDSCRKTAAHCRTATAHFQMLILGSPSSEVDRVRCSVFADTASKNRRGRWTCAIDLAGLFPTMWCPIVQLIILTNYNNYGSFYLQHVNKFGRLSI